MLPQYLVLRMLPVQQVGWLLAFGSLEVGKGKSFTEEPFMATKKKAKKKKH
jgi:hypothetical protein